MHSSMPGVQINVSGRSWKLITRSYARMRDRQQRIKMLISIKVLMMVHRADKGDAMSYILKEKWLEKFQGWLITGCAVINN